MLNIFRTEDGHRFTPEELARMDFYTFRSEGNKALLIVPRDKNTLNFIKRAEDTIKHASLTRGEQMLVDRGYSLTIFIFNSQGQRTDKIECVVREY